MSDDLDPHQLSLWLPALQRWYDQTGNPLYVWQAVARCLNATPTAPIPTWCVPYLAKTSKNLAVLSFGKDYRDPDLLKTIEPSAAPGLVGEALDLWRPKAKSAFSRLKDDAAEVRVALDFDEAKARAGKEAVIYVRNGQPMSPPTKAEIRDTFAQNENVTQDRANRRLSRGQTLYKGKRR